MVTEWEGLNNVLTADTYERNKRQLVDDCFVHYIVALSITSIVGIGAFVSGLRRVEERDLNKDGKLDYVVSKSGEPREYFISRSDGMYEPG